MSKKSEQMFSQIFYKCPFAAGQKKDDLQKKDVPFRFPFTRVSVIISPPPRFPLFPVRYPWGRNKKMGGAEKSQRRRKLTSVILGWSFVNLILNFFVVGKTWNNKHYKKLILKKRKSNWPKYQSSLSSGGHLNGEKMEIENG